MYSATICRIKNVRKHPTADRMLLASACGFQVIVGLNTAENTLGIFFPSDGALSRVFAEKNDLIRRTENGVKCGGLFDDNCRVRAQKLRGQISEGFWCELSYLEKIDAKATAKLKEGDELTELNGIPICNKYYTPATRHQINRQKKTPRKNPRFKEHVETAQFRKCVGSISVDSLIYITEKIHGTSGRYGRVLCEQPLTRWEKIKRFFNRKIESRFEYEFLAGTRRVVLGKNKTDGFYNTAEFRLGFMKDVWHLLNKGEIIYGEIVGYTDTGASIMPRVYTKALKDKELTKKYGDSFVYKYGCEEGTCKFFVYRITMVNEDGVVTELPWFQVKTRAASLGLQCVPELDYPYYISNGSCICIDNLKELVAKLVEGPSTLDPSHIREGVVLRVEKGNSPDFYKEKSFTFRQLEDNTKTEDAVDMEEAQE